MTLRSGCHGVAPRIRGQLCEQTGGPWVVGGQDVPAEVSKLLVDTLESHGEGCAGAGVWYVA